MIFAKSARRYAESWYNKDMQKRGLNQKQQRFVLEYLKDSNGAQAAIRAGYAARSAREIACALLAKHNIKEAIQKAVEERNQKLKLDAQWVVKNLQKVHRVSMRGHPIFDKDGNLVGRKVDTTGANKALELIGRHLGIFVDKHEHTGKNGTPLIPSDVRVNLSTLSDDELESLKTLLEKAKGFPSDGASAQGTESPAAGDRGR